MNLKKINSSKIDLDPKKIFGFMVVKNEALRLPYFLNYYRDLGVDQFIIIDNGSIDRTLEILISREDICVFSTTDKYGEHCSWIQHLLSLYGINRWCLILDADELLFYPHCDLIKLQDLCGFFDAEKSVAMHSILLDMYSNIPIDQVEYKSNQNPLKIVSWFDPDTHYKMKSRYYGGMRERVFGVVPCITKYPLFYFDKNFRVSRGMHEISEKPTQSIRGVLLHFKYMQDFHKRATEGARNGQYWNNSFEYKAYAKILKKNKHLNLWHQKSVKFLDNKQLIKLGIEETSGSFENYVHNKFSV